MDRPGIAVGGRTFGGQHPVIVVGRDDGADVRIDHHMVSRHHFAVKADDEGWLIEDLGSTNGTFVGGERITSIRVDRPRTVRLGISGPEIGIRTVSSDAPATHLGRLTATYAVSDAIIRIGRSPENDLEIDDLLVSRFHAELAVSEGQHILADLGSSNGTYVNGERVQTARLGEGDIISIGHSTLVFGSGALKRYEDRGSAALECEDLTVVTQDGRVILDRVSLSMPPSSLVAVVGPSGAGKTTLLNALTGFRPADSGSVHYGGRDVYANYEDMRRRMGYVPQQDILHTELPVRRALGFAAALRFPADVDAGAREARVAEVLDELNLGERADVRIDRLSGGQRKRTSVAIELMSKPALLFLDEPTSGLDPANEQGLMSLLRELAHDGRTVLVVTHSVQSLDLCDRVLYLAPGGIVAFFGPPSEALEYFASIGCGSTHGAIFRSLEERRDLDWADLLADHPSHSRYIADPLRKARPIRARIGRVPRPMEPSLGWLRQASILVRRHLALIGSDRKMFYGLMLQAPLFGGLFLLLVPKGAFDADRGGEATLLAWLIVIGTTWLGSSNAIREIVKESAIYRRERSVGLSIRAYVISKVLVLGSLVVAQSVVLVVVALARQSLPPTDVTGGGRFVAGRAPSDTGALLGSAYLEVLLDAALVGLAATTICLLLSTLVRNSDQALVVLPLLLVAHVVVSQPFTGSTEAIKIFGYASSARWGTDALGSTLDLNHLRAPGAWAQTQGKLRLQREVTGKPVPKAEADQAMDEAMAGRSRWRASFSTWGLNVLVLLLFVSGGIAACGWVLRRRDQLLFQPKDEPGTPASA